MRIQVTLGMLCFWLVSCHSGPKPASSEAARIIKVALSRIQRDETHEALAPLPKRTTEIDEILAIEGFEKVDLSLVSGSGSLLSGLFKGVVMYRMKAPGSSVGTELYALIEDDGVHFSKVPLR